MSYSPDSEIHLDLSLIESAFRRGLRVSKLIFLNELKAATLNDLELRTQTRQIERAFTEYTTYLGTKANAIQTAELQDFERYGLTDKTIRRIGYHALQLENTSPKAGSFRKGANGRSFSRQVSQEESYEEDFEDILDEDEADESNPMPTPYKKVDVLGEDEESEEERDYKRFPASPARQAARRRAKYDEEKYQFDDEIDQITSNHATPRLNPSSNNPPTVQSQQQSHLAQPKVTASVQFPTSSSSTGHHPHASSSSVAASSSVTASGIRRRRKKTPEWIVQRRFTLGKQIGEGSFGTVFEAMNDVGIIVAVKRMNILNKSSEIDDLLSEIDLMRGLSHRNIVEYLGAIVDTEHCFLYIFQEWVSRGSVASLLKDLGPFQPGVVRSYTRQVLLGLEYLHAQGIVHRDIKGGNILVHNDGNVKLADFGASKKLGMDRTVEDGGAIKGTPYFMAPEVLSQGHYGRKGDIWAVGCTMIQMFTGEPPWKDRNLRGIMQLHALLVSWDKGPPPCRTATPLPADAQDCLEMCFQKSETARPTASELLQCLFLREELEDSSGSCEQSFYASGRDHLEESGTITKLREEISIAQVSKSRTALHSQEGDSSDLIGRVDRQLYLNNQGIAAGGGRYGSGPSSGPNSGNNTHNPYGYRDSNSNNGHTPIRQSIQQQQQMQQLLPAPNLQFAAAGVGGGAVLSPFTPRESTPATSARSVPPSDPNTPATRNSNYSSNFNSNINTPAGSHGNPASANPFASPARILNSNNGNNNGVNIPVASSNNPFGRGNSNQPAAALAANANAANGGLRSRPASGDIHHALVSPEDQAPARLTSAEGGIRDSLANIKKKAIVKAQQSETSTATATAGGPVRRYSKEGNAIDGNNMFGLRPQSNQGSNRVQQLQQHQGPQHSISSQRDSEDYTPPLKESSGHPTRPHSNQSHTAAARQALLAGDVSSSVEELLVIPDEEDDAGNVHPPHHRHHHHSHRQAEDSDIAEERRRKISHSYHQEPAEDKRSRTIDSDDDYHYNNHNHNIHDEDNDDDNDSVNMQRPGMMQRFDTKYFEEKLGDVSQPSNNYSHSSCNISPSHRMKTSANNTRHSPNASSAAQGGLGVDPRRLMLSQIGEDVSSETILDEVENDFYRGGDSGKFHAPPPSSSSSTRASGVHLAPLGGNNHNNGPLVTPRGGSSHAAVHPTNENTTLVYMQSSSNLNNNGSNSNNITPRIVVTSREPRRYAGAGGGSTRSSIDVSASMSTVSGGGNGSGGVMRKSSSTSDSLVHRLPVTTASSASSSAALHQQQIRAVPKLANIERTPDTIPAVSASVSNKSATARTSNAARTGNAASSSAMDAAYEQPQQRPYTSKAALGSFSNASNSNNTSNHSLNSAPLSSRISPRLDSARSTGSSDSNQSAKSQHKKTTSASSGNGAVGGSTSSRRPSNAWRCLKCGAANTHPAHCESCATVRGNTGSRSTTAVIQRL